MCIQQSDIRRFLLDQALAAGVQLSLEHCFQAVNPEAGTVTLVTSTAPIRQDVINAMLLVGADGGGSSVRAALLSRQAGFDLAQEHVRFRCRSIRVLPTDQGRYVWPCDAAHIWPNGDHILVALPVRGSRFVASLIAPSDAPIWERVGKPADVLALIDRWFPDAAAALGPTVCQDLAAAPARTLRSVRCSHTVTGSGLCVALVGAAATLLLPLGVAPADLAAEDCLALGRCVVAAGGPRAVRRAVEEFSRQRREEAVAAADMAGDAFWRTVRAGRGVAVTPTVRYCEHTRR
jgi:2-polyprenyl-6-methoxyphenol hydroxylase-like FAD-dependent oxidoreductase